MSDDAETFEVLTYNLQMLPRWVPTQPDPRVRAGLIAAEVPPTCDLLVFQETFDLPARALLLEGLRARGYPHHTELAGAPGRLWTHSGLTVVSRWPIVAQTPHLFPRGLWIDHFASKGAIHVVVEKAGRPYHVFATHTQSDVPLPGSRAVRAAQFQALRAFVDGQAPDATQPVVIAGDLNVDWYHDEEFREMLALLDAAWLHERGPKPEFSFDRRNQLMTERSSRWLDYVLVSTRHLQPLGHRGRLHICQAPWRWGRRPLTDLSDHYAVSLWLAFP